MNGGNDMDYSNLVFTDGVQNYLDERIKAAEACQNIFIFGSARGGVQSISVFKES